MREFNTREAEGNYSITFETDDKKAFEQVQTLCRMLVDGKDGESIPKEWIEKKCRELYEQLYLDESLGVQMLLSIGRKKMSYESPIKMYIDKVTNNIIQEEEDYVISEIHKLGIVIDKEELMRALQYDRSQYELGFHDGSKNSIPIEWIYKWLENIPNNWRGYNDDSNYNIDGEVSHVNVRDKYNIIIPCIGDMLDDWFREVKNG